MSIRTKIIITIFLISSIISTGLMLCSYSILKNQLLGELEEKIRNIAYLGAQTINVEAFSTLASSTNEEEIAPPAMDKIESSKEFAQVSEALNKIRYVEPRLVKYVYTFVPTADPNKARFVVDADLLEARRRARLGIEVPTITEFNSAFDVSALDTARRAIKEGLNVVEKSFTFDATVGSNLMTGYAPILGADKKTVIGFVGIDMTDTDVSLILLSTTKTSIIIVSATLIISLLTSFYFGKLLTQAISILDATVHKFSQNDFSARANVTSRDEIGRLGKSLNEMANKIHEYHDNLETTVSAYSKFVPKAYMGLLKKQDIRTVALGDYCQQQMTVVFTDIRNFTTLSENFTPKENFEFLNSFLQRMGPVVRKHNGIIDKYIGDAIMALFSDTSEAALQAAIEMVKTLDDFNKGRKESGYAPIQIGVGVHTGSVILGTIGELERMDGTAIGDAVNLSSRIESLCKVFGANILVSDECFRLVGTRDAFLHRYVGTVRVKGRSSPVKIHEIFDGSSQEVIEIAMRTLNEFSAAMEMYQNKRFREALDMFRAVTEMAPHDKAAAYYRDACKKFLQAPPPDWQGVEVFAEK